MKQKTLIAMLLVVCILLANQAFAVGAAQAALPPRHVSSSSSGHADQPVGAYLQLDSSQVAGASWAVVQWQDSAGGWHDVEGWGGNPDNSSRWWVAAHHFGAGPFRWVVKGSASGAVIGASQPFQLPVFANHTLQVAVAPVGE